MRHALPSLPSAPSPHAVAAVGVVAAALGVSAQPVDGGAGVVGARVGGRVVRARGYAPRRPIARSSSLGKPVICNDPSGARCTSTSALSGMSRAL